LKRPRVLVVVDEVGRAEAASPRHGSAAHVAATVAALEKHFETFVVYGEDSETGPGRPRRPVPIPALVRGARLDLLAFAEDRRRRRRLQREIAAFRPEVVYERSRYLSTAGLSVARRAGIPLVSEVNGLLARDARTMYRSPLESVGHVVERRKLRRADAVVTVSPGLARLLVAGGADSSSVAVVPNTVDPSCVRGESRPVRAGSAVIGWVGHLMQWHVEALELLVSAAPSVLAKVPHARFVVIGGGPGLDALIALVAERGLGDRFVFTGPLAGPAVAAALDGVDIGVIPAVFDYAFPVKLVDMGAVGLPVACPGSADLDEMLDAGREYEPFAPGAADALAAALIRLSLDLDRRHALGAALLEAVRTRYTWDVAADLLRPVIERVLLPTAE
jgi:glycosyltransferase involved in cell wall biosynthesis